MRASGPKLSKDGVVTSTEVGVQLEGVETRRATVDLAKSRATLLLAPLARPPRLEALVEVGAERGARRWLGARGGGLDSLPALGV